MDTSAVINVNVSSTNTPAAQYKTIILKPNYVEEVNTLTQLMVSQSNTKYVIKYDFTLGEDITIPENCVLEFDGGCISGDGENKNIVYGNKASMNNPKYYIFKDCLVQNLNIGYIDPRWFGADCKAVQDSSSAFSTAVEYLKYYTGAYIYIEGMYRISQNITVDYNLNIKGCHSGTTIGTNREPSEDYSRDVSIISVDQDVTAFTVTGSASVINIENITASGGANSTFIKVVTGGAPGRPNIIRHCEFGYFDIVLDVNLNTGNAALGNLTISDCNVYSSTGKFIRSRKNSNNYTLTNLVIKDCTIECGGGSIDLDGIFGNISIINNILEGYAYPIKIATTSRSDQCCIDIENNYFETASGVETTDITIIGGRVQYYSQTVTIKNNSYFHKCTLSDVYVLDIQNSDGNIFTNCRFGKAVDVENIKVSSINKLCLFDDYPETPDNKNSVLLSTNITSNDNSLGELTNLQGTTSAYVFINESFTDRVGILITKVQNTSYSEAGQFELSLGNQAGSVDHSYKYIIPPLECIVAVFRDYAKTPCSTKAYAYLQNNKGGKFTQLCFYDDATTENLISIPRIINKYNPTTRPTNPTIGTMIFESNKPIWWNGTGWVDATGATV